jgi:hypothetical protein
LSDIAHPSGQDIRTAPRLLRGEQPLTSPGSGRRLLALDLLAFRLRFSLESVLGFHSLALGDTAVFRRLCGLSVPGASATDCDRKAGDDCDGA